jgi:MFS family permease
VPWLAMIKHPPFTKLLIVVVAYSVSYGGITAFTVAYLRAAVGMSEALILLITSVAFIGGLSSLWLLGGARLERHGSKPVLMFSFALWLLVLAGWVGLAGKTLPVTMGTLAVLAFFMGLLAATIQMSNTRLAMAIIPVMGRNHFFALYSVANNLVLGIAPVAWGLLIDAIGTHSAVRVGLDWNRFTVFFAAAGVCFLVSLLLAKRLDEPQAGTMEELMRELLINSPQRVWMRFWPRG